MIASLRGKLAQKALDHVVIDVGGVGYHLVVSTQTLAELPGVGEPVFLLCHTHVREDALQLYGFLADEERLAFGALLTVSGIGPKLAVTVLSGLPVAKLVEAIAAGDHKRLQAVPGIGKKMAERLVVELKDRFARMATTLGRTPSAQPPALGQQEVVDALVNLGYKRSQVEKVVAEVVRQAEQPQPAEQVLRRSLAAIAEL